MARLILASASPRRRELLEQVGLAPQVLPADIDETRMPDEPPTGYVRRLARAKARAALSLCGPLSKADALVAADTTVHLGEDTFGKPTSDRDATSMLRMLSGRTHQVSTGVCVMACDGVGLRETSFVETTDVTFFELGDDEIAAYVASGESRDKAGAYGAQATGRLLVRELRGDYFNVVGLPVARVVRTLADLGHVPDGTPDGTCGASLLVGLLAHSGG